MGYDGCIYKLFMEDYQLYYDAVHYLVYADFIRNLHWTNYSRRKQLQHTNTFLLHGGNNTDTFDESVRYTNLPDDY